LWLLLLLLLRLLLQLLLWLLPLLGLLRRLLFYSLRGLLLRYFALSHGRTLLLLLLLLLILLLVLFDELFVLQLKCLGCLGGT
jgi:hypothetical protein